MIIHSPIISGSLTFADGATVTYPEGGVYSGSFSGSYQGSTFTGGVFTGDGSGLTFGGTGIVSSSAQLADDFLDTLGDGVISGSSQVEFNDINNNPFTQGASSVTTSKSIIPSSLTLDLGSSAYPFRDLYLSSASLYIDGTQVISSNTNELIVSTDANQSLKLLETGADTITLQTANGDITITTTGTGNIELDAPVQIGAGNQILSSDGNSIQFGEDINVQGNITLTGTVDGVDVAALSDSVTAILSGSSADKDSFAEIVSLINSVDTTNDEAFASFYTSSNQRIGSLESFTSSIDSTIKTKLNADNIISESGQVVLESADKTGFTGASSITTLGTVTSGDVTAILPAGTISGSEQIDYAYIGLAFHPLASGTNVVVSGSSQISADQTDGWAADVKTQLNANTVISSSAQITITESQISDLDHYTNADFDARLATKTTTDLDEGINKYYTDARVKDKLNVEGVISGSSQVTGFVSTDSAQALSSNTDALTFAGNILTLRRGDGSTDTVNLSAYLDDTNLARVISGVYDTGSQELVFTRDDASTFSIDASMFLDDTNLVTSVNGRTGAVTTTLGDLGVTATAAEINKLDGVTASTAEINILDGLTSSTAELNFVDGVTSNIQTQLNSKAAASHTHTASDITDFDTEVANNSAVAANTAKVGYTDALVKAKLDTELVVSGSASDVRSFLNVENGATADQSASEIKTAYESNSNTNAFTDAEKSKLAGIDSGANDYTLPTATDTVLGGVKIGAGITITSGVISADNQTDENFTTALKSKLDGIEAGANNYTHPTYDGDDISLNTSGAQVIDTLTITTDTQGHVSDASATTRTLTLANLGFTGDTNAEVNQNAFSNVAVSGQSTVAADGKTDTLTLAGGGATTITTDASTDTITISSVNTTYTVGDGGLTQKNFTTTLYNKLTGIEASADVTDTENVVAALTAGSNITIAADGTISSTYVNTQLSTEQVQDIAGAMVSGNSETGGISVTYDDTNGKLNFAIADDGHNHTISQIDGLQIALDGKQAVGSYVTTNSAQALSSAANALTLSSNILTLTRGDGTTDTVNLSAYLDEDSRSIASGVLNGATGIVTFTRDDSTTFTLDLSDLLDDTNLVTSVGGYQGFVTPTQLLTAIKTVDGAGSGLDADLLDGLTSGAFLRSNANDTASGVITFSNTTASTSTTTGAITVAGGVGVGGDMYVGGDVVAYASSDERLKKNIEIISKPIDKVMELRGVTWNWKDEASEAQKSTPAIGVIAQDVEKVLPQLVDTRDNGYKAVDYGKMVGLLIEAIKDQQKQIDELKSRLQ